jgi:hypothetical protein
MRQHERTGFENGERVQITEEDPSKHNLPGVCLRCNEAGDLKCPHCGSTHVTADGMAPAASSRSTSDEKFRLLLIKAQEYRNSKFFLGCVLIATGDPAAAGATMEEFGAHWGVGKAAVSKLCVWICEFLDIDPGPYQKSKAAKNSYRQSNRRPAKPNEANP